MKIIAIIQARVSSTRLPNKVMKLIEGKAMLAHQIARIERSTLIDKVIVATSDHIEDDDIFQLCSNIGIDCFRGSLNNVLDRYYQAAQQFQADHIVRLTGDCPLLDPQIIDETISYYLDKKCDYTSNCLPPSFPDGLDVEVFTMNALKASWSQAEKPSEKEHVTQYIRNNREMFSIENYLNQTNLSNLRWTVDEPEDFTFVCKIYQYLYKKKPNFTMQDVLTLLDKHPELSTINNSFNRDEGLAKSIEQDISEGYK